MSIFLRYEAQDGNPRLGPFRDRTIYVDGPTTGADGPTTDADSPTTNEHLCSTCGSLTLNDLVALKASVGLYLPYVGRSPTPRRLPFLPFGLFDMPRVGIPRDELPPIRPTRLLPKPLVRRLSRPPVELAPIPPGELPPIPPVRRCALCILCGTRGVGSLIRDQEALKECTIKRKTLRTAIGISSRPPEKEFEQLAVKLSSGRPRTIGVAAEYGSYASDFIKRRTITDPLSPASTQRVMDWMTECRDTHPTCRQTISGTEISFLPKLPTRVIDVGGSDNEHAVRLLVTDGQRDEYVTLSHCWGNGSHAVLTKASLPALERSMIIADLPLTIQDAITTTRALGFRYLWIDSVCIVQDSAEDWDRESHQMGSIYELSFCTIAATCAKDSASGFLKSRSHTTIRLKTGGYMCLPDQGYMYFTNQPTSGPHCIEEATLNTRGWVLQERLLSRRIIHFAEDQIYWECRHHFAAEDGLLEPNMKTRRDQLIGITRSLAENASAEKFVTLWLDIIERYSQLSFTFEKDRLPALLGLKERLAGLTHLSYIDGHWFPTPGSAIPRSLLFYVHGKEGVHCAQTDCPSWSWEGKGSAVTYEVAVGLAQVTYLRMEGRALFIRGHVFRARLDPDEDARASRIQGVYCDVNVTTPQNSRVSRGYQDYAAPLGQIKFDSVTHMPPDFVCLWVFTHAGGSHVFLALEEMQSSGGLSSSYRRVGMGSFPPSATLQLGQQREIKIV